MNMKYFLLMTLGIIMTDPTTDACDVETGQCFFGCSYGFTGENCSVSCPSNCAMFAEGNDPITCDATTLECTNGCTVNFTGSYCNESCPTNCDRCSSSDECTECKKDSYRVNGKCIDCQWQCYPPTNLSVRTCAEDTGTCEFGCKDEWYGQRCKTRCKSTCKDRVCERLSGSCLNGCVTTEFTGLTCEDYCNDGCLKKTCDQSGMCLKGCLPTFWGDKCDQLCNTNCRKGPEEDENICDVSDGTCLFGCTDDLYWDSHCTTPCSSLCANTVCEQMTGNCTNGCNTDTVYGIGCTERCNDNCRNGTCFRDGNCNIGCLDGRFGAQCDKPCASHCFGDVCDRDHGFCTSGCKMGWYGALCTETCGLNCVNRTCYIDTGNCTNGRVVGSEGSKCDKEMVEPAGVNVGIVVGSFVGGIAFAALVVIVVVIILRRHRASSGPGSYNHQNDNRDQPGAVQSPDNTSDQTIGSVSNYEMLDRENRDWTTYSTLQPDNTGRL